VFCAVAKKLKSKKCELVKKIILLRWLLGLAVGPCRMLSQKFGFMSVSLMVARLPIALQVTK
jgi:hypothetical protein